MQIITEKIFPDGRSRESVIREYYARAANYEDFFMLYSNTPQFQILNEYDAYGLPVDKTMDQIEAGARTAFNRVKKE